MLLSGIITYRENYKEESCLQPQALRKTLIDHRVWRIKCFLQSFLRFHTSPLHQGGWLDNVNILQDLEKYLNGIFSNASN